MSEEKQENSSLDESECQPEPSQLELLNICTKHKKSHQKNSESVKPFKCDVCEKSFVIRFNLKRHIRDHTAEKPV